MLGQSTNEKENKQKPVHCSAKETLITPKPLIQSFFHMTVFFGSKQFR